MLGGGNASIDVSSDDVGYGGIAGILIEPVEGTRFGVTYTSQVKLDLKDKPTTNNLGPLLKEAFDLSGLTGAKVDLGLTIPNQVMVSGYHDLTDSVAIMGNGRTAAIVDCTASRCRPRCPSLPILEHDRYLAKSFGDVRCFSFGLLTSALSKLHRGPCYHSALRGGKGICIAKTRGFLGCGLLVYPGACRSGGSWFLQRAQAPAVCRFSIRDRKGSRCGITRAIRSSPE